VRWGLLPPDLSKGRRDGARCLRHRRRAFGDAVSLVRPDPQWGAGGEAIEVAVGVQQRRSRPHARSGDQAVERLADRDAGTASSAVQRTGQHDVVERLEAQDRERPEMSLDELRLALRSGPLEHIGHDHIGECDRLTRLDQVHALRGLRVRRLVQHIDSHAHVDDDHERPRRLCARSPSHVTRPRRSSTPTRS